MEGENTSSSLKALVDKNKTLCIAGGAALVLAVAVALLGGRLASVLGLVALVGGAVYAAKTRSTPKHADEAPAPADEAPAKEEEKEEKKEAPATPVERHRPPLQRTARSKLIAGFENGSVKLADVLPAAAASTLARRSEKAEKQATLGRSAAQAVQRNRVMGETVATERAYVAYLATLREVYIEPLRAAHILDEQQMRDVFGFVEVIEGINRTVVLEKLEQWAPDGPLTPGDVFDAFTSQAGYLQSYSSYINNFDDSRARLAELQESVKPFAEFLEKAQHNPRCCGLTLEAFLIMPVQRLPRYVLLINELLKATPESSADHAKLARALEVVKGLTASINRKKSEQEQRAMVRLVQSQLAGLSEDLMGVVSRRLVREGVMSLVPDASAPVAFEQHKRQLYLFDDLLVVARAAVDIKGRHRVETVLHMRDVHATTTRSAGTLVLVVVCQAAAEKCFAFVGQSDDDTQEWADEIQRNTQGLKRRMSSFA